jgi:protoporphyrinogen oxidase|tara:strand:- start:185 stop:1567 length:1383 start_codon:yes stop_codon:yes gene_type:complete
MKFLVIGGGIAGLLAAYRLRFDYPDASITLIEREQQLGGLLAGADYGKGRYFDLGTHVFQETGNAVIDNFLLSIVPPEELIHFDVGQGDLAGSLFSGHLQTNTHFTDLRNWVGDTDEMVASLRSHLAGIKDFPSLDRCASLLDVAHLRFGQAYASQVIAPMLEHIFGRPAETLSGFALLLLGLTRVVVDDFPDWLAQSNDEKYRSLFGVPDQRLLPREYCNSKRSFYSRKRGSCAFVEGITKFLERSGVHFKIGTSIVNLDLETASLHLENSMGQSETIKNADGIVLATGVIGVAKLLGLDLAPFGFDRPMPHDLIHLELEEPVDSDLCYFYGLDPNSDFFRITNYRALTNLADDCRLTVEVLGQEQPNLEILLPSLTNQLQALGFLSNEEFTFSQLQRLPAGFPVPTVQNMKALELLGKHLENLLYPHTRVAGIGARPGLFFQNEIMKDVYERAAYFAF